MQCAMMKENINSVQPVLLELEGVAERLQDVQKVEVAELIALANALDSQFAEQQDELSDGAIRSAVSVATSTIDVGVLVGGGAVVEPLSKAVLKISTNAQSQLTITDAIDQTVTQLVDTWTALNKASAELAKKFRWRVSS